MDNILLETEQTEHYVNFFLGESKGSRRPLRLP